MSVSVLSYRESLNVKPGRILIDGEWQQASTGRKWMHVNPATNEEIVEIEMAGKEDADRAVLAARRAFDEGPWPKMPAKERTKVLLKIADLIEEHADELTKLQSLDMAMPMVFGQTDRVSAKLSANIFRHQAGWIDKVNGDVYPQFADQPNMQFMSVREPIGVAVGITPWNAPMLQYPEKVAPALAAGCCIIMKPSEYASLAVLRMSELIAQELPPGVFQVLTGDVEAGDALVRHPGVDKISFTGSRAVGEHLHRVASDGLKRVTLELGGKSAAVVFPDVKDLKATSQQVMAMMSMGLSGQVCSITSRALVHKSIYNEFLEYAQEQVKNVKFGNPFDLTTTSCPMVNKQQLEKVSNYIKIGQEEGARLVFGGDRPDGELSNGNWINPALFADVTPDMRIAQEEIFGPVLSVIPFETEEEAIAIANNSDYGLSAGVYTDSFPRAWRMARGIRSGTVGVNGYMFHPNSPFGGYKASGIGREGGITGIESFTELKTIMINLAD